MRKSGLTLVEALVTIGLLGLLAALILPGVQSARGAAQRARCANHLRQIGLALQSYHTALGVFPMACGLPNTERIGPSPSIVDMKQYSAFTLLLPFLDQEPLFHSINFDVGIRDPYLFARLDRGSEANATSMGTTIGLFLCPSDSVTGDAGWTGGTNYRVNLGSDRWNTLRAKSSNGPLMSYRAATAAATTDGLSNTVALSEKLRGRRDGTRFVARTDMMVGGLGLPSTPEESLVDCAGRRDVARGFYSCAGLTWFVGTLSQTCYNHAIEPNSTVPDCVLELSDPISGLVGARSNHPGGVNTVMADASVRFVTNSIRREVWTALGTRAGGEVVGASWQADQ